MKLSKLFMLTVAGFIGAQSASAAVWTTQRQWSEAEEVRYSEWVKENWTSDIFTNSSSKYYGIPTDCADAGYTMRIIYSYERGLPHRIYSKRTNKYYSNTMRSYDNPTEQKLDGLLQGLNSSTISEAKNSWDSFDIQKKKLFLYIRLVNALTSTHSLPANTITPKLGQFKPGMLQLIRRYHTYTIRDVDQYGVLINLNSTVPSSVRNLTSSSGLKAEPTTKYEDGVLAFRWPNEEGLANWKINRNSNKSYSRTNIQQSTQQHTLYAELDAAGETYKYADLIKNGGSYNGKSYLGLSGSTEPISVEAQRMLEQYCDYAKARVEAVDSGVDYQNSIGGRCMDATEYDNYSTPSRDKRLKQYFMDLAKVYKKAVNNSNWSSVSARTRGLIEAVLTEAVESTSDWGSEYSSLQSFVNSNISISSWDADSCNVNYGSGTLSLEDLTARLIRGDLSYDPNVSRSARWGDTEENSGCTHY